MASDPSAPAASAPASASLRRAESSSGCVRYRLWARLYGLGAFAHLTLPDALQWSWLLPNLALAIGAAWLLWRAPVDRSAAVPWALCALGIAVPLLWLGDQLTQSVTMLAGALATLATTPWRSRDDRALMRVLRWVMVTAYGLAAFHKMNHDFLDPALSCATGGMRLLAENWSLPAPPDGLGPLWPPLFLAVEVGLALSFRLWPRLAFGLAIAMHLPLTIVFAPSFAWVMIPGWVAFATPRDVRYFCAFGRRHRTRVLAVGLLLGVLSQGLYFIDHWVSYPAWQIKEFLLWPLAVWILAAMVRAPRVLFHRRVWRAPVEPGLRRMLPLVFVLALLGNGFTPYLGVQFHHTSAMLSNLRIDDECWNHLFVPEAVRLHDPYVRVEHIDVGGPVPGRAALSEIARDRLWHPASLRPAIAEWCAHGASPTALTIRFQGVVSTYEDVCEEPLDLPAQSPGRFQTNLARGCEERCIH